MMALPENAIAPSVASSRPGQTGRIVAERVSTAADDAVAAEGEDISLDSTERGPTLQATVTDLPRRQRRMGLRPSTETDDEKNPSGTECPSGLVDAGGAGDAGHRRRPRWRPRR